MVAGLITLFQTVASWFTLWAGFGSAVNNFNSGLAGFTNFAVNAIDFFMGLVETLSGLFA